MSHAAATHPLSGALPAAGALPCRAPASPTDETERLADYGLIRTVLDGLLGELEACPGVVLLHADGRAECVDGAGCPADPALHAGTAHCREVAVGCC